MYTQFILLSHSAVLLVLRFDHLVPGAGSPVEVTFNTKIAVLKAETVT